MYYFSRESENLKKKKNLSILFRYVFFLEPCNLDIVNRRIKSIALCVSKCPSAELKTYNDLKQFALTNGEKTAEVEVL